MSNLQKIVSEFVEAVRAECRLEILQELGNAVSSRRPAKPDLARPARPLAKGQKRSPESIQRLESLLHAYVVKHPGQRIEQIADGMNISTRELNLPVKKLLADKRMSKKGVKRATTYSAR